MSSKYISLLVIAPMIASLLLVTQVSHANDDVVQNLKSKLLLPEIDAKAFVLMEYNSGLVVASKNAVLPYPPASITKLMSNYVVYEALANGEVAMQDQVAISEHAWRAEGSRMFAKVDSKVELQHLLKSTVIQSGNDAAIALAEHTAGSESAFAQRMNQSAVKLGLKQSNFLNSSGLPAPGHMMSASDIAILSAGIIRDFPSYYVWYSEKDYTHNKITQYNRNKLIWKDQSVDGLKTGHTEAAGYCLVGSAKRNGQRWIAVVLGSSNERSREAAVLSLLNYGFAAFEPLQMLDQQGGLASKDVYLGEVDQVLLQAPAPVNLVVPVGRTKDVVTELQLSPYYTAPIQAGQPMGIATISLDGKTIASSPLVATSSIEKGGIAVQLLDSIKLQWRKYRED